MTVDRYSKFILTLIAIGILGLNFHLFQGSFIKDAYAFNEVHKIAICNEFGNKCANIFKENDKSWLRISNR